jgi:hypothetical protein
MRLKMPIKSGLASTSANQSLLAKIVCPRGNNAAILSTRSRRSAMFPPGVATTETRGCMYCVSCRCSCGSVLPS